MLWLDLTQTKLQVADEWNHDGGLFHEYCGKAKKWGFDVEVFLALMLQERKSPNISLRWYKGAHHIHVDDRYGVDALQVEFESEGERRRFDVPLWAVNRSLTIPLATFPKTVESFNGYMDEAKAMGCDVARFAALIMKSKPDDVNIEWGMKGYEIGLEYRRYNRRYETEIKFDTRKMGQSFFFTKRVPKRTQQKRKHR